MTQNRNTPQGTESRYEPKQFGQEAQPRRQEEEDDFCWECDPEIFADPTDPYYFFGRY